MKIHEYQAKEILAQAGIRVPRGRRVESGVDAKAVAKEVGGKAVVKAQIHAGGRGKAGGVKLAADPDEAQALAEGMLGKPLVTRQTGPKGQPVRRLLVEEQLGVARELYLAMVLDRESARVAMIASAQGGMEIEEVAREHPDQILKVFADPVTGLMPFQVRNLGYALDLDKNQVDQLVKFVSGMYDVFVDKDASLVEINPLVVTDDGTLLALDAKMNFDDNAISLHPEILKLRDESQEEPAEVDASRQDLSYIRLDGDIGCMVNGAGLAMATMDIIKLFGGEPANFLDVGGGTDARRVEAAFKIILSDENVRAVLVNIFGGIVRCDVIAEGVVAAVRECGIRVPLVVRLQGTKQAEGREILKKSGLDIVAAETMQEAARVVVESARRQS